MTDNTRDFLKFISFAGVWSLGARLVLEAGVHPLIIFGVWAVGFVWGVTAIISGVSLANYFVAVWLAPFVAVAALALLSTLI